jgi:hypothetical protein
MNPSNPHTHPSICNQPHLLLRHFQAKQNRQRANESRNLLTLSEILFGKNMYLQYQNQKLIYKCHLVNVIVKQVVIAPRFAPIVQRCRIPFAGGRKSLITLTRAITCLCAASAAQHLLNRFQDQDFQNLQTRLLSAFYHSVADNIPI